MVLWTKINRKNLEGKPFKQTLLLFFLIFSIFSLWLSFPQKNRIIHGDGCGYYAYLPAFVLYQETDFKQSMQAHQSHFPKGEQVDNWYLTKTNDGKIINKYMPGLAVMQLPFFLLATGIAKVFSYEIDGYSMPFMLCYYFGMVLFAFLGVINFYRFYLRIFPDRAVLMSLGLLFASPFLYYSFNYVGHTQIVAFFLISILVNRFYHFSKVKTQLEALKISVLLGLLFMVRPTDILIVLLIPFYYPNLSGFFNDLKSLISPKFLFILLSPFIVILLCFFFLFYVQNGTFFQFPYVGEGFNFGQSKILNLLFSFRNGIFWHTPLAFMALALTVYSSIKKNYRAIILTLFLLINLFVIGSWWSWDYESTFGNRALIEFFPIFLLGLGFISLKYFSKIALFTFFCTMLFSLRYAQKLSGQVSDQRFTMESYFKTLKFWDPNLSARFYFTRSAAPFGKVAKTYTLVDESKVVAVDATKEFLFGSNQKLDKDLGLKKYLIFEAEKKINQNELKDVFIVFDAYSKDKLKRFYTAIPFYEDKFEGKNDWKKLRFEYNINDNLKEIDTFMVYLWNSGKSTFQLKNIHATLQIYR